jgi:ankyrin repeat protein
MSAVALGERPAIEAIVRHDSTQLNRVMDRTNLRRRPLHLAVVKKQPASLEALILLGADLDAADAAGLTALDQAAIDGERAMAERLMDAGATVMLPAAVALDLTDTVDAWLRDAPDALRPGGRWGSVIVAASRHGSAAMIEALIRCGASVDVLADPATSVDQTEGYTALHAAAWNGNTDAVRVLLRHGANPRVREHKYCATPAGWADYAGHRETRDAILEGAVDIFDALQFDRLDLIPRVLASDPGALTRPYGTYADCSDLPDHERSETPLAWATRHGRTEAARLLRAQSEGTADPG